jgi:hypothetical protein
MSATSSVDKANATAARWLSFNPALKACSVQGAAAAPSVLLLASVSCCCALSTDASKLGCD